MFPTADFLLYCLVSFATPGPNTLMALEQGRRKGFRRGIWLNLGMLCGLSAVMLLCLAFSKVLYDALPLFQPLMRLVGAAYMLYQAWKCLNRKDTEGRDGDLHHLQLPASPLHLSSRSGGHGAVPGLSGLRLRAGVAGLRRGPQPLPLPPPAPRQRRHGFAAGLLRVEDFAITAKENLI